MQLLDEFVADSPWTAKCNHCGTSDLRRPNSPRAKDRVLQVTVEVEFAETTHEGNLYICESCLLEAAALAGASPPAKAEELRRKNRELGYKNKALEAKLTARDALDAAQAAYEAANESA